MTIEEINNIPIYTIEDACAALYKLDSVAITPDVKVFDGPYQPDSVIDEEKSIKWNREYITEANTKYYAESKRLKELKQTALTNIINKYLSTLSDTLNEAQLNCIYNYAYSDKHSYGYWDVFVFCEELVDLIESVERNK